MVVVNCFCFATLVGVTVVLVVLLLLPVVGCLLKSSGKVVAIIAALGALATLSRLLSRMLS